MNAGNLMRPGLLAAEWNPPFLDLTDAEKAPCRRSPTPGGVAVFSSTRKTVTATISRAE